MTLSYRECEPAGATLWVRLRARRTGTRAVGAAARSGLAMGTVLGGLRFLTSRCLGMLPGPGRLRLHDQDLPQASAGTVQPGKDGAARRAHDLSRFGTGEPVDLDQGHGVPEGVGELGKRPVERLPVEPAQCLLLRSRVTRGQRGDQVLPLADRV